MSRRGEPLIELSDGQKATVRNDSLALKIDDDLLPADLKQLQLLRTLCLRHLKPPLLM